MLLLCRDRRAGARVVDLGRGGGFWTGRYLKKARPTSAGKPLQIEIVINKNVKTQVHDSTAKLGYPQLWRENEERFLHCADRHLAGAKVKEKRRSASVEMTGWRRC